MSKKDLQAAYDKFNEKHTFSPGDFVEWKPGMKNRSKGGLFIVSEVLAVPIRSSEETGSNYFSDMVDLSLACLDSDGDYTEFMFDSRRIQPVD